MEGPGPMRPGFPPRFDGPEFYNRMPFDDHHPRHRRHDDRRRFPRDDNLPPGELGPAPSCGPPPDKPDRKSRWGSGSPPPRFDQMKPDDRDQPFVPGNNAESNEQDVEDVQRRFEDVETEKGAPPLEESAEPLPPGSTTPIRDEFEVRSAPEQMEEPPQVERMEEPQAEPVETAEGVESRVQQEEQPAAV